MTDLPLLIPTNDAIEMLFGRTEDRSKRRRQLYRLYEMIDREEIGARKIGDRWYIKGSSMKDFVDDET